MATPYQVIREACQRPVNFQDRPAPPSFGHHTPSGPSVDDIVEVEGCRARPGELRGPTHRPYGCTLKSFAESVRAL